MAADQPMNLRDDTVSFLPALNPWANLCNLTRKLMTQDDWRKIGMVIVVNF
jgi:hypothetical protein